MERSRVWLEEEGPGSAAPPCTLGLVAPGGSWGPAAHAGAQDGPCEQLYQSAFWCLAGLS